ncbi:hypothetical protein Tco_0925089 [Tanacetum coccineum]|uniref:Uncharacterized protein n=1 Tax=Tanacetum coccineum TaxID=301880 RepID=A0ABQ5D5U7_9ASTR
MNCLLSIIMAQQQHAAYVHPDELCPPNKRYDLMDANKKVDPAFIAYVNNIHVDYAELHGRILLFRFNIQTSSIPYPRFTKIIITTWISTEEMKHTKHYRMYTEVFGIDVPLTQSQPTESTQGTHRTPSTPRSPNPNKEAAESSAPR